MKRLSAFALAVVLAFGLAGCGDDDKDDSGSNSSDSGDSGGGSDSSNPDVQAYCDAVDDYVAAVKKAVEDNDAAALSDLQTQATDLANDATKLTDISADEAQEVADCTKEATDAAADLANIGG